VELLGRQLEKASARAAAAEAALAQEQHTAAAVARDLAANLEAAKTRATALSGEAAEVGRLNLALQRRLEKAEAKVDRAAAEQADMAAKLAAVRGERDAASERAARWEKEAVGAHERLRLAEAHAAGLEKANTSLRADRDAAKRNVAAS
jgi:chromosome segregation ATPase